MKRIHSIIVLFLAAVIGPLLTSCAGVGSSGTESLLSAAGFVARTPENAQQRELYAALPAYKLHRGTYKGNILYAYKDEKEGVAYVGNETAYQRYQALAVQRRIASDYYNAAEMNRDASWRWYGAYGPYVGYRHAYIVR